MGTLRVQGWVKVREQRSQDLIQHLTQQQQQQQQQQTYTHEGNACSHSLASRREDTQRAINPSLTCCSVSNVPMFLPANPVKDGKPDPARFLTKSPLIVIRNRSGDYQQKVKMRILQSRLLALLLCCYLSGSQANRVYVHPFYLFAAENVSCETLQPQTPKPLETLPVAPLDIEVLTPDSRDPLKLDAQNITVRTAVLAELLNSLGLRMYQSFSSKQQNTCPLSGQHLWIPHHLLPGSL
ncbi:hypothetical protein E3U43_010123 [Larimichthys crocea]|uniref:Uncharacterized protein n=1 Tax=Larimichthys crocea TaxID=215358 RepID=A0ACD3QE65_LARCR|nr:hypothetical protein E3U43_010123 [Larimichthys crocea]